MKRFLEIMTVIISVSISGSYHEGEPKMRIQRTAIERSENQKCFENPDPLYNRQKTLEQLAEILNTSVFGTRKDDFVFDVKNEKPLKFTIFDLTDTSNKGTTLSDCIYLKNNHVYHFAPIEKRYSFSHIVILEDGAIKVFKSINCKGKGDSLEDVINYLNQKLDGDSNKQKILDRVKNYRDYGLYTTIDTPDLECK